MSETISSIAPDAAAYSHSEPTVPSTPPKMSRRDFLKLGGLATASLLVPTACTTKRHETETVESTLVEEALSSEEKKAVIGRIHSYTIWFMPGMLSENASRSFTSTLESEPNTKVTYTNPEYDITYTFYKADSTSIPRKQQLDAYINLMYQLYEWDFSPVSTAELVVVDLPETVLSSTFLSSTNSTIGITDTHAPYSFMEDHFLIEFFQPLLYKNSNSVWVDKECNRLALTVKSVENGLTYEEYRADFQSVDLNFTGNRKRELTPFSETKYNEISRLLRLGSGSRDS